MIIIKNTFENYLNNYLDIHNNNILKSIKNVEDFDNIIIYGSEGIGKYTECLNLIKKFSPSKLKYERKLIISNNKSDISIKLSDIHFEIDMQLLGYNSRSLFNEIYNLIVEIISTRKNKLGIIVCKNFQDIDSELLEIFYSYMKNNFKNNINIKFIIITCSYSFLSNNIINICKSIKLKSISNSNLKKIYKKINNKKIIKTENNNCLFNSNNLKNNIYLKNIAINKNYLFYFYNCIINNNIDFNELRNNLYDLLIYKININDFINELFEMLVINKKINKDNIDIILDKIFKFFNYYNNNYRPIFHLENYLIFLIKTINEY